MTKLLDVTSRGIDKLFTQGELKAEGDGEWLETPGKRYDSGRRSSGRKGRGRVILDPFSVGMPSIVLTGS